MKQAELQLNFACGLLEQLKALPREKKWVASHLVSAFSRLAISLRVKHATEKELMAAKSVLDKGYEIFSKYLPDSQYEERNAYYLAVDYSRFSEGFRKDNVRNVTMAKEALEKTAALFKKWHGESGRIAGLGYNLMSDAIVLASDFRRQDTALGLDAACGLMDSAFFIFKNRADKDNRVNREAPYLMAGCLALERALIEQRRPGLLTAAKEQLENAVFVFEKCRKTDAKVRGHVSFVIGGLLSSSAALRHRNDKGDMESAGKLQDKALDLFDEYHTQYEEAEELCAGVVTNSVSTVVELIKQDAPEGLKLAAEIFNKAYPIFEKYIGEYPEMDADGPRMLTNSLILVGRLLEYPDPDLVALEKIMDGALGFFKRYRPLYPLISEEAKFIVNNYSRIALQRLKQAPPDLDRATVLMEKACSLYLEEPSAANSWGYVIAGYFGLYELVNDPDKIEEALEFFSRAALEREQEIIGSTVAAFLCLKMGMTREAVSLADFVMRSIKNKALGFYKIASEIKKTAEGQSESPAQLAGGDSNTAVAINIVRRLTAAHRAAGPETALAPNPNPALRHI
ncbi:MAG: hypothetical protein NTV07_02670 [Candidatus Omnitrophica bacterium]|nr:hypothetical protein [Candidatus Omnitrophota bacterium]